MPSWRERLRWHVAHVGILLWLILLWLGPNLSLDMMSLRHEQRCGSSRSGECFSDYLPVLELFFIPAMVLILLFPMAIFARSLFAPPSEWRALRWRGALGKDGVGIPGRIVFAALLLAFVAWRWSGLPLAAPYYGYHAYSGAVTAWLVLGIAVRWLDRRALARMEATKT